MHFSSRFLREVLEGFPMMGSMVELGNSEMIESLEDMVGMARAGG